MKYFAEYLEKPGEIVKDTKCLYGGIIVTCQSDRAGKVWMSQPSIYKPVKLFLCSKDIQIGDNISYLIHYGILENSAIGICQIRCNDGGIVYLYENDLINCFKVIGEISPDAVWVQRGDKFDEDVVKGYYASGGDIITEGKFAGKKRSIIYHWALDTDEEMLTKHDVRNDSRYRIIYKIKCPTCKNFH